MEEIKIRQNESKMLKYQFTARYKYNLAEKINSAVWFIAITTALLAFIPNLEDISWFTPIPIIADIIMFILCYICNKFVQDAADLREMFDDYVLGFNDSNIDLKRRNQLNEIVTVTIKRHKAKAEIQMNTSGNDTPPGVKEWYEFPDSQNVSNPILFCLKQNMWWTNKMLIAKCALFLIEAIILIALVLIVILISDISSVEKIICLLGFVIKTIDRAIAVVRYCVCCLKTIGAIEIQDNNCNKDTLAKMQKDINKLRTIPILGKNIFHQKLAKKLSQHFKESIEA